MSASESWSQWRDVLPAAPVGLLVLGTLHADDRWGPPGAPRGSWNWADAPAPDIWAYLLAGAAVLAVALRRWPVAAFALAAGATATYLMLGNPYGPITFTVLITAFSLARRVPLPRSALAAGAGLGVLLVPALVTGTPLSALLAVLPVSAWVVVPFSVGLVRRAVVEARQRERAEAERAVLDAERMRLASEVHDVVGHGLAAIQMQADIALHVAERRPDQAREALSVISRASAEALAELRATLTAISPESASGASRAPTPGLDRLADLCARMREAGVEVSLEVTGERRPVPPAVDIAAYRVVQESLTNVVKHAAERRARVRITYLEHSVRLTVDNPARPQPERREGFGIAGIRRRTADVGGSVEIGADGDRFRVRAELPA